MTVSLIARLLMVAGVTVFVSVVTEILLIQKFNAAPGGGPAIIVLTALAVAIGYLYWRPGQKRSRSQGSH
jgi:hypothetical protein